MASPNEVIPSADFRRELMERGGASAARCYQCATCSSVCELAPAEAPFPRRQMLWAQWGMADKLAADPSVWLCHQCNDCTERCPRDAKPGDVMSTLRALVVEKLAFPGFIGKLVGKASITWPLLIGIPILYWIGLLFAIHGGTLSSKELLDALAAQKPWEYHMVVPYWSIYVTYIPLTALVLLAIGISAKRFWGMIGQTGTRSGSLFSHLIPVMKDIATHKRFNKCGTAKSRRWGHFALLWGFVGAAITTTLAIIALYLMPKGTYPLAPEHPFKWLGNLSALLLMVGGIMLLAQRLSDDNRSGTTTAFDGFFLGLVLVLVVSGIVTQMARFLQVNPNFATWIYIIHLGSVFTLFATFPFSKFAHMIYRTMAMIHERMTAPQKGN